jgi:copper chaperone
MISFKVDDMSCNHCVGAITRAVQATDVTARVVIDLPTHMVSIDAPDEAAPRLQAAIADAGYTPIPA